MQNDGYPVVVKRSLRVILEDLDQADAAGVEPPPELMAELRSKIDGNVYMLEKWEAQKAILQSKWMAELEKRMAGIQAKINKREDYIKKQMVLRDMTLIRGNVRKISLRKNKKKTVYLEKPSADAYEKYPGFVKVVPGYAWNKDNVRNALSVGREMEFVKQTQGNHISYKERGTSKKDT